MPIHLSNLDPLQPLDARSQRNQQVAYLRAEGEREHAQHMAQLDGMALWLHRPVVAIVALIAYALLTWLAFVVSVDAVYLALIGGAIALAVIDWHNFRTFHGHVNWPLLKLEHPALYWLLIVGMALFSFVPAIAYLAQCLQTASAVQEARHARIKENITRLEQELQQPLPSAGSALPQEPSES